MQPCTIEDAPKPAECPVCLDRHDQEIHDATVKLHAWFRHELERRTVPVVDLEAPTILEPTHR